MGTWHLSGLGVNPGAVTVPLTNLYVLLKASVQDDAKALEFFSTSGERYGTDELKGAPEALIVFTSAEVITGTVPKEPRVMDNWFQTRYKSSTVVTIREYLKRLIAALENDRIKLPKYFYAVKVNHKSFEECLKIILPTISALRNRELLINMVGGANPINAALLTSAGFTTAATLYYLFQEDTNLLHPDRNRLSLLPPPPWEELPFFNIDMGRLYMTLKDLFSCREKVSLGELRKALDRIALPPDTYLPKIRASWVRIEEGDVVRQGVMLERWTKLLQSINSESPRDFSKWKNWANERGILTDVYG